MKKTITKDWSFIIILIVCPPLGILIWLIESFSKNNDRKYELEKFKAETERMKAEASTSSRGSEDNETPRS